MSIAAICDFDASIVLFVSFMHSLARPPFRVPCLFLPPFTAYNLTVRSMLFQDIIISLHITI
jgi:hypothetical protein